MLPCVTLVILCYLVPFFTLLPGVTLCYRLCYRLLHFVTLCYPLSALVTLCYHLFPFVTPCSPMLPFFTLCFASVTLCHPLLHWS